MTQLKEKIEKDLKYLNISKLDGLQLVPVQDKKLKEIEKKLSETPQPGYWERFIAPFWAAADEREDYKRSFKAGFRTDRFLKKLKYNVRIYSYPTLIMRVATALFA